MSGTDIRKNGSGYRDDTAFRAICNVTREERKAKRRGNTDIQVNGSGHDNSGHSPVDRRNTENAVDAGKLGRRERRIHPLCGLLLEM